VNLQDLAWLKRPPYRTIALFLFILGVGFVIYAAWSPGKDIRDGRHDMNRNGIWIQHGWLGDDVWFDRYQKKRELFRNEKQIANLKSVLAQHHITDIFPHLCPSEPDGKILGVDARQTQAFLSEFKGFRVMPWIGGAFEVHAFPGNPNWRKNFVDSIQALLTTYPDLGGIHINIEPMPSGNQDFLKLLDEVRTALPPSKVLSVAAYPPPTRWHPFPDVHWEESYFREVAKRSDQLAVMMYDTSLRNSKLYQHLMSGWTQEILQWSGDTKVLLGLPTYNDAGVGYHHPDVENLSNGILGIHRGLSSFKNLPHSYQGTALYCEWEMDEAEWKIYRETFLNRE
jgi:hypothetical protein